MLKLRNKQSTLTLDGYTVIVPSICVGNAAQLACDLLIASKELQRIGSISHPALIPIYGPSAYQHEPEEKAAACELYATPADAVATADKLLVIQLRTPLISRHTPSFHAAIAQLLKGAQRIVVLSGSFGFERRVIEASPYAYLVSEPFAQAHTAQLAAAKWKPFDGEVIYGGGNAMQLYRALEQESVPVMLLFRYLLEGDNSTDASLIVRELSELCDGFLHIGDGDGVAGGPLKLTVPISWRLLFGNDVPELIF